MQSEFECSKSPGIELTEILVAALLGILLGLAAGRASGDDYLSARVAAAVSLARKTHPSQPPEIQTGGATKRDTRPVVFLYVAPFRCPPCDAAKRDIKAWKDAPMRFVLDQPPNIAIESYPTLHWNDANGKGHIVTGWDSPQKFEATWRATMKAVEQREEPPRRNRWPPMTGYQPGWTWPGDLRQHLQQVHGVGEAGELTQDQAEALHDALHEGYSLEAIRRKLTR